MEITIKGEAKENAALVLATQGRQRMKRLLNAHFADDSMIINISYQPAILPDPEGDQRLHKGDCR